MNVKELEKGIVDEINAVCNFTCTDDQVTVQEQESRREALFATLIAQGVIKEPDEEYDADDRYVNLMMQVQDLTLELQPFGTHDVFSQLGELFPGKSVSEADARRVIESVNNAFDVKVKADWAMLNRHIQDLLEKKEITLVDHRD